MLAAMHGKIECVQKLLGSGANVSDLLFLFLSKFPIFWIVISNYSFVVRSWCLIQWMEEHACTMLLTMATQIVCRQFCRQPNPHNLPALGMFPKDPPVLGFLYGWMDQEVKLLVHWIFRGFARFVNLRDGTGATPLHLASSQRWPNCVHILLECGALVCASNGRYG